MMGDVAGAQIKLAKTVRVFIYERSNGRLNEGIVDIRNE